jgi:hypothetical protein
VDDLAPQSFSCSALTDRTVTRTYIAKTNWASRDHFNGHIAGLYAVDALLTPAQIAALIASMYAGADPQRDVCRACPAGQVPGPDGACGLPVTPAPTTGCPAGYAPDAGQACAPCPAGQYKSAADLSACLVCPAGTASNTTGSAAACPACPAGQIQTQQGRAACADCPADHFRETDSSASLDTDCTPCPEFSASPPGTALEADCLCDAGYL